MDPAGADQMAGEDRAGPLVELRSLVATPPVVDVIDQVAETLATKLPETSRLTA